MNRDELVEHLRNEIASRDERIGELENVASYYASRNEELREEIAAIKAQGADGRDVSIVDYAEKTADVLDALIAAHRSTGVV